jgi:hypothetical protein
MPPTIGTERYTVEELTQLWIQGDLSADDGVVDDIDSETIQIAFEGKQDTLFVTYNLSEGLTNRTDKSGYFNICEYEPDVEEKPLPVHTQTQDDEDGGNNGSR